MAVVSAASSDWTTTEPVAGLRFVLREGKRILQQRYRVVRYSGVVQAAVQTIEWRDVPLVDEVDES